VILDFIAQLGTDGAEAALVGRGDRPRQALSSITSEPQASFRHKFVLTTTFAPVEGGFR